MMFRWLADLFGFGPIGLEEVNRKLLEWREQDPRRVRYEKKKRLEQDLEDAEWILKYERRLTRLQGQVAEEITRTGDRGSNPKRLQNLQSHLRDVRRSITHE